MTFISTKAARLANSSICETLLKPMEVGFEAVMPCDALLVNSLIAHRVKTSTTCRLPFDLIMDAIEKHRQLLRCRSLIYEYIPHHENKLKQASVYTVVKNTPAGLKMNSSSAMSAMGSVR